MTNLLNIVNLSFIFLFNICHVLGQHQQIQGDRGEIVFTSILYRHGERNPKSLHHSDPYRDPSYWPEGLAMLTNKGKRQHYQLGQWLRKRYTSLIPDGTYSHDLVYVQSTDWDRTLMSAESNLAGLFYPNQQEMWSDLRWQPVPVHTVPKELDKLLAMYHPCPKAYYDFKAVKRSTIVKNFNKEHVEIYQYLSKHTGEKVFSPAKVEHMYVTLLAKALRNYTLPSWAERVFPDKMYPIGAFAFQMRTMTKTLKRLTGGPLLKEMITHMKQKRSRTLSPDRNLWIYSGHDVTVASLLDTMGVFEPHMPPFAATVLVELRKDMNDFFVSVHYKNSTEEPTLLTIPGCSPSCPLDTFESLLSGVIPKHWDLECQTHTAV